MVTEEQIILQEEVFQNGMRDGPPTPWLPSQPVCRKHLPSDEVLSQGFQLACGSEASCFTVFNVGMEKPWFLELSLNYRAKFSGSQISILQSHLWPFVSQQFPDISQMTALGKGKSCPRNACFLFAD